MQNGEVQKNSQEKTDSLKLMGSFILKALIDCIDFLKELVLRSGLLSIFILILLILFFVDDDFRNKHSSWFFEGVSKITGRSSTSGDIHIHGSVDATVSRPFKDAAQACWYYHANYENSHPYTVLWKKTVDGYPKIRVIAESAYWQAEKCIKEKGEIKLIGIEQTKHSIEAQFGVGEDFIHTATSNAYYRSAISFDKDGRITERKVLSNKDRKECDFEYVLPSDLGKVIKTAPSTERIECLDSENNKQIFKKLKKRDDYFNIIQIDYNPNVGRDPKDLEKYHSAILRYIEERENLHKGLAENGCGAISIEPELKEDSRNLIQTSIAFLCLKESGPHSHVRLMHRISEQKF